MEYVQFFQSSELAQLEQVGGKALSLIQLTRAGLPVPPGFVLTVKFFEQWMDALKQSPAWAAMAHPGSGQIGEAALALQERCRGLKFTPLQKDQLGQALQSLHALGEGHLYAVRSSSPEEDMDGASFAGGYETSLGVTDGNIESAILRSFTSSFDERIFLYKQEHGFPIDQPRIAVVVQQQLDAESAGVAFSLNPLNNCYDEAVINANHGLGESVVSGAVDPDQFIVDKFTHKIIETRIGKKQALITLNHQGGTTHSARANVSELSITPGQVLALTRLLEQVETLYKKPVDIEWAGTNGKIFLLQARPITTYLPLPEEMMTAPGQPRHLYANSTLIEQGLQEPLSVLGTDFLGYLLKKVGGALGTDVVGPGGMTFTAGGGYYMDLSYGQKLGMRGASLAPGSAGDPRVMAILDGIDMKQYLSVELPPQLKALSGKMPFTMLQMAIPVLKASLWPQKILARYKAALPAQVRRFEAVPDETLSFQAQAVALTELLPFFYEEYVIPMVLAGQLAQQRLRGLFKNPTSQVRDHLINLGISLPGNKTAEMGELMYSLASAQEIARYDNSADFLAALAQGTLSPDFTRNWQYFLDEFGARCPAEIDPATPRIVEQPALLFEQLKNMSLAIQERKSAMTFFDEARAKREAAFEALVEVALKSGKSKTRALKGFYKTWVTLGGYRETGKHYVIKVVELFRRRALVIAKRFVAQGRLDQPDQIFDLTIADIDRAQADPSLDLRALAQERSMLTNKIRKSKVVARIIDSRGKVFYPPRQAAARGEWSGVPISPGVVQGRVKVFHHATEKKLLHGEILVARATDPGWTPLFINAGGIILEIGGALQHGAVVAREYGIPCISGLDDATNLLVDGQLVEVDGSNGTVRLIE